jgi:hypothetical protein
MSGQGYQPRGAVCVDKWPFSVQLAHACNRRYVRFNVEQLCTVAESVGGELPHMKAIEKLEGGSSKALLMRKEDGSEMTVKISSPIAGPPKHTTALEMAVLQYRKPIASTQ